jgi:phosphohistidine swiveling domain-containing protein
MTVDPSPVAEVVGVSAEFPVEFELPGDERLTWERDDMHIPFALTPLSEDWSRVIAQGFGAWRAHLGVDFPPRTRIGIWNGYVYFAYVFDAEGEERKRIEDAMTELFRKQIPIAEAYWRDEALPELHGIYRAMDDALIESGAPAEAAEGWRDAWAGAERAWRIHFIAINGPYQVLDDLADLYEKVVDGAGPGEAMRLIQGGHHELYETELGVERLGAAAARRPAVAAALRAGTRSPEVLRELPDGPAFVAELQEFLDEHGHLGQSFDDLPLASWGEEPGLLLAEIAKRLDSPPEDAESRRSRLAREADELAAGLRARLADRPDELERFERVLEDARRIGPITEIHNYWIDRKAQAHVRRLALRAGARLVRDGVVDRPEDVFYLDRAEVADLLLDPVDRRALVAERREVHERRRRFVPPRVVGKAPVPPSGPVDRFDGAVFESTEPAVLRGTGASAGRARGTARIVLTSAEFDRVQQGDIIVCPSSNPSWVPVFAIAGGLVTNTGGVLSHAAVVAREFGLPAVVGTRDATTRISDGQQLEIDGTAGTVRIL